jgi:hypothetical protein
MPALPVTPLFIMAILFCCCQTDNSYPYAIKDFRKPLQTQLTYVVSKGIVGLNDDSLRHMITDQELVKLSQSEHPVLRATAFREMLDRKSFDHFNVIMDHLGDTAIVATDAGEWGIEYAAIADDIIHLARWKTNETKERTIDAVLTKHNYLRSAFNILLTYVPKEKHYKYIKDMAFRENRPLAYNNYRNTETELALYGLAKYKKKEDIEPIKEMLMEEIHSLNEVAFRLISEYPNPAYLEFFETYYPRQFYRTICRERTIENAVDYITSLATYKNDRSARILDSILNRKPLLDCAADSNYLRTRLSYAIWGNPCPAYAKLRLQVEAMIKESEKNSLGPALNYPVEVIDSSEEKIRW